MSSVNQVMHKRFAAWLDNEIAQGRLPTGEIIVSHKGKEVMRYRNPGLSKTPDNTVYRLYSMTKPVVSLAVLLLFEEGKFQLNEPIWKFLGSKWKRQNLKVVDIAATEKSGTLQMVPCKKSITIFHLLTHTSGLSHGLAPPELKNPVDEFYFSVGLGALGTLLRPSSKPTSKSPKSLEELCDRLSECPLVFQPGTHWQYSYAVDLLGRIVEVVSGNSLEEFVQERIFKPLGMFDTSFFLTEERWSRTCDLWAPGTPDQPGLKSIGPNKQPQPRYCSGSGGLYGTATDYMLFAEMLLRGGIGRNGVRVASPLTIEWMTKNHLREKTPEGRSRTIRQLGFRNFSDDQPQGLGFGLGVAVWAQTPTDQVMEFDGNYFWSGAASTHFFVSPKEELAVVFCTQLLMPDPFSMPIMQTLRAIVYGSLNHLGLPAHSKL